MRFHTISGNCTNRTLENYFTIFLRQYIFFLFQLRKNMVDRKSGGIEMDVKMHYDNMVCRNK